MKARTHLCAAALLLAVVAVGYGQPVITNQPQKQRSIAGTTAMFTVGASGDRPLSYQWRFNDENLAGKTNSALNLINVQVTNAGRYVVVITNTAASITSEVATLTVDPALTSYSGSRWRMATRCGWPREMGS